MKKTLLIIGSLIIIVCGFIFGLYFYGLGPVTKQSEIVEFNLTSGTSKIDIINDLKSANLIKSKISGYIYVFLNHNLNLQAGKYALDRNMGIKKILNKINNGNISEDTNTYNLRFTEGKRLVDYAKIIAEKTNTTEQEVLNILNDKEYLKELIIKYWFLTDDILKEGIYYPLEGYLFASTYELYKDSDIKTIITKMLDGTNNILSNYRSQIESSSLNVHDILTMASIVELEGAASNDRAGVAGVFYNRLKINESLGSDVTTYYATRKNFNQDLTSYELNNCSNGYNTRNGCNRGKLPIGPICSPSLDSIASAINPSNHDYLFFVADKNKKTYFTKTNSEHEQKIRELKAAGLWYEYK